MRDELTSKGGCNTKEHGTTGINFFNGRVIRRPNWNRKALMSFISPTHKRTEGRAPVWGSESSQVKSEFTSKDTALQGGSRRSRCQAERKIMGSDCAVVTDCVGSCCLFSPNPLSNLFEPSRTILNLRQRTSLGNFDPADWGRAKWFYFCERQCAPSHR